MERIRELDRYPKLLLLLLVVMAVGFGAVYGFVTSRVGFAYCDAILVPRTEGGLTLYEGTIDGSDALFTVGTDTVTFRLGSKTYGPYTAREDPTAVTDEGLLAVGSTGVEILEDGRPFFRGSVTELDGELMLLSGDGAPIVTSTATLSDGTVVDGDGNIVDVHAPDAGTILRLLRGPEPEHRGHWPVYLVTLFFSAATAVSILFADELFRYGLSFRVRDPDRAEPSDWELASRTIGWTFLTGVILCGYWMGLR